MTDADGLPVTVRRDRRTPNVWAVPGPGARRIGSVKPVHDSTACWWALNRAGGIQGDAATFGAAVGLLVDAAIDVDTRHTRQPAGGDEP